MVGAAAHALRSGGRPGMVRGARIQGVHRGRSRDHTIHSSMTTSCDLNIPVLQRI